MKPCSVGLCLETKSPLGSAAQKPSCSAELHGNTPHGEQARAASPAQHPGTKCTCAAWVFEPPSQRLWGFQASWEHRRPFSQPQRSLYDTPCRKDNTPQATWGVEPRIPSPEAKRLGKEFYGKAILHIGQRANKVSVR